MRNIYLVANTDWNVPPVFGIYSNIDAARAAASKFPFVAVTEWPMLEHYPATDESDTTADDFDSMMDQAEPATLITPASVRRLNVAAGETLVVSVADDVDQEHFKRFSDMFRRMLPDDVKVIITNRSVDFSVIASKANE